MATNGSAIKNSNLTANPFIEMHAGYAVDMITSVLIGGRPFNSKVTPTPLSKRAQWWWGSQKRGTLISGAEGVGEVDPRNGSSQCSTILDTKISHSFTVGCISLSFLKHSKKRTVEYSVEHSVEHSVERFVELSVEHSCKHCEVMKNCYSEVHFDQQIFN